MPRSTTRIAVASFLVLSAYLPLLILHCRRLWTLPQYDFFPLLIAAAAYLIMQRARTIEDVRARRDPTLAFLVALAMTFVAGVSFSPFLMMISVIVFIYVCLATQFQSKGFREFLAPCLLLLLIVPLPMNWGNSYVHWLQRVTISLTSPVLDWLNVSHLLSGNVIELTNRHLMVEEACSGVNSSMAIFATVCVCAVWMRIRFLHFLILTPFVLVWTLFSNVLRIVIVAKMIGKVDLSVGMAHEALGMMTYLLAVFLLWSTYHLLDLIFAFFYSEVRKFQLNATETPSAQVLSKWTAQIPTWSLVALGVIAVLEGVSFARMKTVGEAREPAAAQNISAPDTNAKDLPKMVKGWKLVDTAFETRSRNHMNGQFSRVWIYSKQGVNVTLSLDSPFTGWHNLSRCYVTQGWQVEVNPPIAPVLANGTAVAMALTKPNYRRAFVIYGIWRSGKWMTEPQPVSMSREIATKFITPFAAKEIPDYSPTFQVQLYTESAIPKSVEQLRQIEDFYLEARRLLVDNSGAAGR